MSASRQGGKEAGAMLAIGLGLAIMGTTGSAEAGLCVVTVLGAWLVLASYCWPYRWVRVLVAVLVLQDLFLGGLIGPYPEAVLDPARLAVFFGSMAITGLLMSGAPVPDTYLPLRGAWLRRFLAIAALFGMVQLGPWLGLWKLWVSQPFATWPLVPGLVVAAWLLWITAGVLVERPPLPHGSRLGCPS